MIEEERRKTCLMHVERLTAVEHVAASAAEAVERHKVQISDLRESRAADRELMRALTTSTDKLSESFDSFGTKLDALLDQFSTHLIDFERDKRQWPRLAVGLWVSSIGFGLSLLVFVLHPFFPKIERGVVRLVEWLGSGGGG
jgi:hypothetical protein